MEARLGRFPADCERPEPLKFAWPIVLVPELFTTPQHLALLRGYLATIGWEVYAPDLRAPAGEPARDPSRRGFESAATIVAEAVSALGRGAIVVGYGLGGLLALKAAEDSNVKAAVALAPMIPGVRSALVTRATSWPRIWPRRMRTPPRGTTLFRLLADADPFQREALARALVPDDVRAALEVTRGKVRLENAAHLARLIVVGDSDPFVQLDAASGFAEQIGATLRIVRGYGHWLVGGRALERALAEAQRFLVRSLGADLLLLYDEEWKDKG
jgi:alpha-beta hydrolase superfamily lysophospholipase